MDGRLLLKKDISKIANDTIYKYKFVNEFKILKDGRILGIERNGIMISDDLFDSFIDSLYDMNNQDYGYKIIYKPYYSDFSFFNDSSAVAVF